MIFLIIAIIILAYSVFSIKNIEDESKKKSLNAAGVGLRIDSWFLLFIGIILLVVAIINIIK
mgnify:CR=1 FL=1